MKMKKYRVLEKLGWRWSVFIFVVVKLLWTCRLYIEVGLCQDTKLPRRGRKFWLKLPMSVSDNRLARHLKSRPNATDASDAKQMTIHGNVYN